MNYSRRPGYTLIEMLITITIFSGLLILVLGSFASTSSSSAKVNTLRVKSQEARKIIDQISTDFRFVDISRRFKDDNNQPGCTEGERGGCNLYDGYMFTSGSDRLRMVLNYPDSGNNSYTVKEYKFQRFNGHDTLTLYERRDCSFNTGENQDYNPQNCANSSVVTDIISTSFDVSRVSGFDSFFKGLAPFDAATDKLTPYLSISLSIKPSQISTSCSDASPGTCYKLETKILPGVKL